MLNLTIVVIHANIGIISSSNWWALILLIINILFYLKNNVCMTKCICLLLEMTGNTIFEINKMISLLIILNFYNLFFYKC